MFHRWEHIVKELREQSQFPDHHPMIRALFADAADLIEELIREHHRPNP